MKLLANVQYTNEIPVHFVDSKFYGIDNEIPDTILKKLAHQAQSLPTPLFYGKFINHEHYMTTLDLVLSSTMETRHRVIFFIKEILPRVAFKNSLLDVGPGNGALSVAVAEQFDQITLVDTCEIALNKTEKDIVDRKNSANVVKVWQDIVKTTWLQNHYDMIMLSHMLYYIDPKKWLEVVDLCYGSLKPNGLMAIVLSGESLGKAKLMQHFSGKSVNIDYFIQTCAKKFSCSVEVFKSIENFYACDLNTMLHIAGFLLYDINTHTIKSKLAEYIIKHHQINKNLFKLSTQQEFILIKKNK